MSASCGNANPAAVVDAGRPLAATSDIGAGCDPVLAHPQGMSGGGYGLRAAQRRSGQANHARQPYSPTSVHCLIYG